jgi:hypothetical protein
MPNVDRAHDSSGLLGEINTLALDCRSCAIAQWAADLSTRSVARYVAEIVDEDVVVISGPELDGLLVVPCQHIGGLEELSVPGRGHLLAALRRASLLVQERNSGSATRVVVMTGPPASEAHVCFHVVPSAPGDPVGFSSA